ncbi:MAG: GAF domain-containing protein [Anaerolineae bacterium]|nr:GAF domain-containing protein [Anaerolineae bacterium]
MELSEEQPFDRDTSNISLILDLRRGYLRTMLIVTMWAIPLPLALAMMIPQAGTRGLELWPVIPFAALAILVRLARYLLDDKDKYDLAVYTYTVAWLVTMALFMVLGDSNNQLFFRHIAPFILTLIASIGGMLLSPGIALTVTALSFIWTLVFALSLGIRSYDFIALLLSVISTGIAYLTAGSLYQTTHYALQSSIRTRERAEEFWRNKEELSKTLKERNWFYQELENTTRALETSHEVGRQITSILKLDTLLLKVIELIQENFGYYFVGVWLIGEKQESLALRAGTELDNADVALKALNISLDETNVFAQVCNSGLSRRIDDILGLPAYVATDQLPHTRAALVLPLSIGPTVLGVLDIRSRQVGAFDDDDQKILQALANQIAIAIRNAQLYASERHRRQLAESLEQTGRVLSSSLDLSKVPGRILDQLEAVVPFARGSIFVQNEAVLKCIAKRGFPEKVDQDFDVTIREGDVYQRIVDTQAPVLIDDVLFDPRFKTVEWLPTHHSWMGIPLIAKDRVIGMISLTRNEIAAFTADDTLLVLAFAGQAAIALENAALYDDIRCFNQELEAMVRQRTEELELAYARLEKLDKSKSDFINITAHELRTPLTVVKGYTQVLKVHPDFKDSPGAMPLLTGIMSGTDRMHKVVNRMLEVAKIDTQALEMVKRTVELGDIVLRVQSQLKSVFAERNLKLEIDGFDRLPCIDADPHLLFKVIDHLLMNAIKYTPDGGEIKLSGRVYTSEDEGDFVEIVVKDGGIGIDPEYHDLIFEKFFQIGKVATHSSGDTKFKGGGAGLGLAIAHGVVTAHGGRIWVESTGHDEVNFPGSTFHVLLPVTGSVEGNGHYE